MTLRNPSGLDGPDVCVNVASAITLTDQLLAQSFILSSSSLNFMMDLRPFRQIKMSCQVRASSASAGSPRIQLLYATTAANAGVIGSCVAMGPGNEISLGGLGFFETAWVAIPDAAKLEQSFLCFGSQGGDGALDPSISQLMLWLR